jgi:cold shock CspA family protein
MEIGIIKTWNVDRGFGFVHSQGLRYFVHISKIVEGTPELFCRVTFDIGEARNPQELPQALNVRVGEKVS